MSQTIIDVDAENFVEEVEQATLPVLIDFWAPWCGPCLALVPLIDSLAVAYSERIKFVKVNVDASKTLAERFNIRGIPALVLMKDGVEVTRPQGTTRTRLVSELDQQLT